MFEIAANRIQFKIERLFVPAAMVPHVKGPFVVHDNCDVASLERAFRDGRHVWIHGSSCESINSMLRERSMAKCVVSDVVRSDLGLLADPQHAMTAPLGSLSSVMFCRSIRSLSILEKAGGWQDSHHQAKATYLYAFECDTSLLRDEHNFPIRCVNVDVFSEHDVALTPTECSSNMRTILVESTVSLATLHRFESEKVLKLQRIQKRRDGYRYVVAIRSEHYKLVHEKLCQLRCAIADLDCPCDACAVVYMPEFAFHGFLKDVHDALGPSAIAIMREAPKWVVMRGRRAEVQRASELYLEFIKSNYPDMQSNVRFANVSARRGSSCDVNLRISRPRPKLAAGKVQLVTSTAPWVSEDVVETLLQTLQVSCESIVVRRSSDGSHVRIVVDEAGASTVESKSFCMPWQNKRCKLQFQRDDPNTMGTRDGARGHASAPERSGHSCALSPLPPLKRFLRMDGAEKQHAVRHATLQRVPSTFEERELELTERVVEQFKDNEDELFDVVRSGPLMQDLFDHVASETGIPKAPPRTSLPSEGDLVEIRDAPLKRAWNGCVMRVRKILPGSAENSAFVEGELVTPTGEIAQSCSVFKGDVKIKKEHKAGRSYYSVRHPAAKLILDRNAGSKWINCKQGCKRALEEAEEVKREWEAEFKKRIDQITQMRICLCTQSPCSHKCDDTAMHVNSWHVLPKGSFGNIVIGSADMSKLGRGTELSERIVKQRVSPHSDGGKITQPPVSDMDTQ